MGLAWQRWHWAGTWEVQPTLRVAGSSQGQGLGLGCNCLPVSAGRTAVTPSQCTVGSAAFPQELRRWLWVCCPHPGLPMGQHWYP